ncbi:MAG: hypothetical protein DYH20_09570 [Gammaproteobacteria bacterium PRO9]|nr:hypothetical protein [Gammaproteobacteria bacterium PRO9]
MAELPGDAPVNSAGTAARRSTLQNFAVQLGEHQAFADAGTGLGSGNRPTSAFREGVEDAAAECGRVGFLGQRTHALQVGH